MIVTDGVFYLEEKDRCGIPLFFLNVDQPGIGGLVKWIAILPDRVIGKHADRHGRTP